MFNLCQVRWKEAGENSSPEINVMEQFSTTQIRCFVRHSKIDSLSLQFQQHAKSFFIHVVFFFQALMLKAEEKDQVLRQGREAKKKYIQAYIDAGKPEGQVVWHCVKTLV